MRDGNFVVFFPIREAFLHSKTVTVWRSLYRYIVACLEKLNDFAAESPVVDVWF